MNPLDLLFGQVARRIQNHGSDRTPGPSYDTDGILDAIGGIFGQQAQRDGQQFGGYRRGHDYENDDNYADNVAPSSQDPWGDPADTQQRSSNAAFGNVRPSSEDPWGDPADSPRQTNRNNNAQFGNVRPASEDPFGDPADR